MSLSLCFDYVMIKQFNPKQEENYVLIINTWNK